jgi:hypothetical protein
VRGVVGQAEIARDGQALCGEGFVEFDHIHLRQAQAGLRQHLAGGRRRAEAHDARRHAGGGHAQHARARLEAIQVGGLGRGQQQRAGAVVDAGGVAGGDRASGRTTPLSLASIRRGVGRGCSSVVTMIGSPFFCGIATGTISSAKRRLPARRPSAAGCAGRRRPGRRG